MKVEDLISEQLQYITSGKSVQYAARLMDELGVNSLVVNDEGKIAGILTSKDIRSVHPNRIVADAMTGNPICIPKSTFIGDAISIMEQHQVKRLIVKDGNHAEGIVTREVLKTTLGKYEDLLTGLYRSAYMEYVFNHFVALNRMFHILFIDLNDFGLINKKHGHPVGDDVLIHFSTLLKNITNEQDYICRYGGDEFVIISTRKLQEVEKLIQQLTEPMHVMNITLSAAVGYINGFDHNYASSSFREMISKASMISTSLKPAYDEHLLHGKH